MTENAPPQKTSLLINRNYAFLFTGQAISLIGDFVFDTTLVLWIATIIAKGEPWNPLAVSGVLVAATLPILLIGPVAGVFVDRWNKQRVMLRMDIFRAILIALLVTTVPQPFVGNGHQPLLTVFVPSLANAQGQIPIFVHLGMLYVIVFLASACSQFFSPARLALIGDVVDQEHRAQATGLGQATQGIAGIIGPPLAAPLLFAFGVQWALLINALTFVVSFLAIRAVRAPQAASSLTSGQKASIGGEMLVGIRYFFSNRVLRTILIAAIVLVLGSGCINSLGVFFVLQNLHADQKLFGIVDSVVGIGIIGGSILASVFAQRIGLIRSVWLSLFGAGIVLTILTRMTNFTIALPFFLLIGLAEAVLNTAIGPLVLGSTPREMVGRVVSVLNPLISAAQLLSLGLAGYLASTLLRNFHQEIFGLTFGTYDTIFLASGVLAIFAGIYTWLALRGVTPATPSTPQAATGE